MIAWPCLLAAAMLGPALGPGYALNYDMVFTPREFLQPWMLGIGGGWPRAVPQDTVVAVLGYVVPGWAIQKVALLAALVLAGIGCARLAGRAAPAAPRIAGVVAATFAIWNPFVAERLVIGHWSLLLAYAAAPWAIHAGLRVRAGEGGGAALALWCALGALTPFGGVGVALVALPLLIGVAARRAIPVVAAVAAVNLPWLVPTLMRIGAGGVPGDGAGGVFGLRAEGPWGAVLTAVGLGGIWNAEVVPASRGGWSAPVLAVAGLAVAITALPAMTRRFGRWPIGWWSGLAVAGVVVAVLGPPDAIPGAVLLRDSQKALGPLALLVAVGIGVAATLVTRRLAERSVRVGVATLFVIAPLAALPDGAWGIGGRLAAVQYPDDWYAVRTALATAPDDDYVVSLPWSTFRDFPFNAGRTLLDPSPRWFDRTVVTDTSLTVRSRDGNRTVIAGDDPLSRRVGEFIARGAPLDSVRGVGVGWALWAVGQPGDPVWASPSAAPADATVVYRGRDLVLVRLGAAVRPPSGTGAGVIASANVVAGVTLLAIAGSAVIRVIRRSRTISADTC